MSPSRYAPGGIHFSVRMIFVHISNVLGPKALGFFASLNMQVFNIIIEKS